MKEFTDFSLRLAQISKEVILPYFHKKITVDTKKDASPVTIADRKAEKVMRKEIEKYFPSHGIIGEEFGSVRESAEWVWVLDPIDGTKSFICGVPIFGTLIALLHRGKPFLGVIQLPALDELYLGVMGRPTTLNGKKIQVRKTLDLKEAVLVCTDLLDVERHQNLDRFMDLARKVKLYRSWGDCYMYTLLARGTADIVVDPIMNYWDIQALVPVVLGAGGVLTSYEGSSVENARSSLGTNPQLFSKVMKCLHPQKNKKG